METKRKEEEEGRAIEWRSPPCCMCDLFSSVCLCNVVPEPKNKTKQQNTEGCDQLCSYEGSPDTTKCQRKEKKGTLEKTNSLEIFFERKWEYELLRWT